MLWFLNILELPPTQPEWPSGTFGLPRSRIGCPPSDNITSWSTGWRYHDTEDNNPNNYKSSSFHMDATIMKNDLNRSFCIATTNKGSREWPKGKSRLRAREDPAPSHFALPLSPPSPTTELTRKIRRKYRGKLAAIVLYLFCSVNLCRGIRGEGQQK